MPEIMSAIPEQRDTGRLLGELETDLIAMLEFDLPVMREQLGDTDEVVVSLRGLCLNGLAVVDRLRDKMV
jgi:hypothetical protein